jgi:sec-independent protein translocase protein TatA
MLDLAGTFIMQMPVGVEWILIIVIIGVAFFGVKKIPQLARSFGKAEGEYRKAKFEASKELEQLKGRAGQDRRKLEEIAGTLGIDSSEKNDDELRKAIDFALKDSKTQS